MEHCFHFLGLRPNPIFGQWEAETLCLWLHEEGFPKVGLESLLLEPCEFHFHLCWGFFFGFPNLLDNQDIINANKDKVKIAKEVHHDGLEDIWRTHDPTGSLTWAHFPQGRIVAQIFWLASQIRTEWHPCDESSAVADGNLSDL